MLSLTEKLQKYDVQTEDVYTNLGRQRRDWKPAPISRESLSPMVTDTNATIQVLERCVALSLQLELPVGAFVRALLVENNLPQTAYMEFYKNILDEEKHQEMFEHIAKIYTPTDEQVSVVNNFRKKIVAFNINPLIKARDLETVLFVPIQSFMRYVGGQALERVIAEVSHDEYRHLQFNWQISDELNFGFEKEFTDFLEIIGDWVFNPLGLSTDQHPNSYYFWVQSVRDMIRDGESERLTNLFNYGIHRAPFEIPNDNY